MALSRTENHPHPPKSNDPMTWNVDRGRESREGKRGVLANQLGNQEGEKSRKQFYNKLP